MALQRKTPLRRTPFYRKPTARPNLQGRIRTRSKKHSYWTDHGSYWETPDGWEGCKSTPAGKAECEHRKEQMWIRDGQAPR
jgi:hypothetical protein